MRTLNPRLKEDIAAIAVVKSICSAVLTLRFPDMRLFGVFGVLLAFPWMRTAEASRSDGTLKAYTFLDDDRMMLIWVDGETGEETTEYVLQSDVEFAQDGSLVIAEAARKEEIVEGVVDDADEPGAGLSIDVTFPYSPIVTVGSESCSDETAFQQRGINWPPALSVRVFDFIEKNLKAHVNKQPGHIDRFTVQLECQMLIELLIDGLQAYTSRDQLEATREMKRIFEARSVFSVTKLDECAVFHPGAVESLLTDLAEGLPWMLLTEDERDDLIAQLNGIQDFIGESLTQEVFANIGWLLEKRERICNDMAEASVDKSVGDFLRMICAEMNGTVLGKDKFKGRLMPRFRDYKEPDMELRRFLKFLKAYEALLNWLYTANAAHLNVAKLLKYVLKLVRKITGAGSAGSNSKASSDETASEMERANDEALESAICAAITRDTLDENEDGLVSDGPRFVSIKHRGMPHISASNISSLANSLQQQQLSQPQQFMPQQQQQLSQPQQFTPQQQQQLLMQLLLSSQPPQQSTDAPESAAQSLLSSSTVLAGAAGRQQDLERQTQIGMALATDTAQLASSVSGPQLVSLARSSALPRLVARMIKGYTGVDVIESLALFLRVFNEALGIAETFLQLAIQLVRMLRWIALEASQFVASWNDAAAPPPPDLRYAVPSVQPGPDPSSFRFLGKNLKSFFKSGLKAAMDAAEDPLHRGMQEALRKARTKGVLISSLKDEKLIALVHTIYAGLRSDGRLRTGMLLMLPDSGREFTLFKVEQSTRQVVAEIVALILGNTEEASPELLNDFIDALTSILLAFISPVKLKAEDIKAQLDRLVSFADPLLHLASTDLQLQFIRLFLRSDSAAAMLPLVTGADAELSDYSRKYMASLMHASA